MIVRKCNRLYKRYLVAYFESPHVDELKQLKHKYYKKKVVLSKYNAPRWYFAIRCTIGGLSALIFKLYNFCITHNIEPKDLRVTHKVILGPKHETKREGWLGKRKLLFLKQTPSKPKEI
jgi:hypothetical protein